MKSVLRPSGIIGFVVVIVLVGIVWLVAAPWAIKYAVEEVGSQTVGAKVEVDGVDMSLSPFGIALHNLQVTNPDRPMENMVQFNQVSSHVDFAKLLMGQVIIDELSATGVRLDTQRTKSGALEKKKEPKKEEAGVSKKTASDKAGVEEAPVAEKSFGFKLPSVDEILQREPLTTDKLSDSFKSTLNTQSTEVQERIDDLPSEASLAEYETRINELTGGKISSLDDLKRRKQALDDLKKSINNDKQSLLKARDTITNAKKTLGDDWSSLKAAPEQDWKNIKDKYNISVDNLGNISRLLFGEQIGAWVQKVQPWLEQLKSLKQPDVEDKSVPSRSEGQYIQFDTKEALPEFLVRKADLNVMLERGSVAVTLNDVTHQQHILGRPMRLIAQGDKLQGVDQLRIQGVFDHVDAKNASDKVTWDATGWRLEDVSLGNSISMKDAVTNVQGELTVVDAKLDGKANSVMKNVSWGSDSQKNTLTRTLSEIDQFSIGVDVLGKVSSPRFNLHSDLDKKLKSAVTSQVKERQQALEKNVKARLDAKVAENEKLYRSKVDEYKQQEADIKQRIAAVDKMLKSEVKGAVEDKKQEAVEKLEEKIKGFKF